MDYIANIYLCVSVYVVYVLQESRLCACVCVCEREIGWQPQMSPQLSALFETQVCHRSPQHMPGYLAYTLLDSHLCPLFPEEPMGWVGPLRIGMGFLESKGAGLDPSGSLPHAASGTQEIPESPLRHMTQTCISRRAESPAGKTHSPCGSLFDSFLMKNTFLPS